MKEKTVDEVRPLLFLANLASYVNAKRASSEMGIKCQSVKLF